MVGHRARKFEPQAAMELMASLGITNVFLPPTALKLMRQANVKNPGSVKLRSIFTGGESLGGELLGWVRETFGIDAHEVFGQTECNLVIGSNANLFPLRPGAMGKATPGFDVRIVNDKGEELPRGTRGIIGVRQPCPCTMIEYWRNPDATAKKYAGEFLLTGDLGVQDEDGYFWYVSREDDVITTAGYRVGPVRDRAHADEASGGRDGGGGRHSRSDPHRIDQGLDRAAPRLCRRRRAGARDPGIRQGAACRPRISALRAVRRNAADDRHRQGAAAGTEIAGVGYLLVLSQPEPRA